MGYTTWWAGQVTPNNEKIGGREKQVARALIDCLGGGKFESGMNVLSDN